MTVPTTWTSEQTAAIAFGGALGISARKIAAQIGKSRNAVIGRAARLGLGLDGKRWAPKKKIKTCPKLPRARRARLNWPADLAERYASNKAAGGTIADLARLLNIGFTRTYNKLVAMGIHSRARAMRRFTPDEDAIIRVRHGAHVRYDDIAAELDRDTGTVRQRMLKLGLHRDPALTILRKNFGAWVIDVGDPIKVMQIIDAENAKAKLAALSAQAAWEAARLRDLDALISGGLGRNHAIRKIRATGLTLQMIGTHLGVTRERIRQICE